VNTFFAVPLKIFCRSAGVSQSIASELAIFNKTTSLDAWRRLSLGTINVQKSDRCFAPVWKRNARKRNARGGFGMLRYVKVTLPILNTFSGALMRRVAFVICVLFAWPVSSFALPGEMK
jgi:hypothetical protein